MSLTRSDFFRLYTASREKTKWMLDVRHLLIVIRIIMSDYFLYYSRMQDRTSKRKETYSQNECIIWLRHRGRYNMSYLYDTKNKDISQTPKEAASYFILSRRAQYFHITLLFYSPVHIFSNEYSRYVYFSLKLWSLHEALVVVEVSNIFSYRYVKGGP